MGERGARRNRPSVQAAARLRRALAALPRLSRYAVSGVSMFPTLAPGDRLLVLRPALHVRPGDIVLARLPGRDRREVVKRVAAVVGPRRCRRYVLLGDNPEASTDSRRVGPVARTAIAGRVLLRYWPDARRGRLP